MIFKLCKSLQMKILAWILHWHTVSGGGIAMVSVVALPWLLALALAVAVAVALVLFVCVFGVGSRVGITSGSGVSFCYCHSW